MLPRNAKKLHALTYDFFQRVLVERPSISRKLYSWASDREGILREGLSGNAQAHQWFQSTSKEEGKILYWNGGLTGSCRLFSSLPTRMIRILPAKSIITDNSFILTLPGFTKICRGWSKAMSSRTPSSPQSGVPSMATPAVYAAPPGFGTGETAR